LVTINLPNTIPHITKENTLSNKQKKQEHTIHVRVVVNSYINQIFWRYYHIITH